MEYRSISTDALVNEPEDYCRTHLNVQDQRKSSNAVRLYGLAA